jgi:hypothetical protein
VAAMSVRPRGGTIMSPVVTPGHNLHVAQHIQDVAAELWQFIPTEPAMVCQRHLARQQPPVSTF